MGFLTASTRHPHPSPLTPVTALSVSVRRSVKQLNLDRIGYQLPTQDRWVSGYIRLNQTDIEGEEVGRQMDGWRGGETDRFGRWSGGLVDSETDL